MMSIKANTLLINFKSLDFRYSIINVFIFDLESDISVILDEVNVNLIFQSVYNLNHAYENKDVLVRVTGYHDWKFQCYDKLVTLSRENSVVDFNRDDLMFEMKVQSISHGRNDPFYKMSSRINGLGNFWTPRTIGQTESQDKIPKTYNVFDHLEIN